MAENTPTSLKPCPFCGHKATPPENISRPSQRPKWEISCGLFCVAMRRDTKNQVVKDWNQRTTPEME